MEENKESLIDQEEQEKIKQNDVLQTNPILLFILFFLVSKQLQKKKRFSSEGEDWIEDEYIVTMGNSPAFPSDTSNTYDEKKKGTILNIKDAQDFYGMMNRLKPYMNEKNQYLLSIFGKWRSLIEDLNNLSNFENDAKHKILSIHEPKEIVSLLQDLKPFIREDYYSQLQQLSDGINEMMRINENIIHLQRTFEKINHIEDNSEKINTLINSLEPFMSKEQKKIIDQLKSISEVIDLMKTAVESKTKDTINKSNQENDKLSKLMELLNLLDSPPTEGVNAKASSQEQDNPQLLEQKEIEKDETPQYEEIFEEDLEAIKELERKEKLENSGEESEKVRENKKKN